MKNLFNSIKLSKPKNNTFDLTHDVKMSGKIGNLMPCCLVEAIPGDSFTLGADNFTRFAPMLAPVMHRFDVTVHYFFVPNRILWENWEKFIVNEPTGGLPYINYTDTLTPDQLKLGDYLGVPPIETGGTPTEINALPFAAYQCVYNEYYRDQNLIAEVPFQLTDGNNTTNISALTSLRKRAWEHDYFTASLPFAQKGQAVDIPLGVVELDPTWSGTPTFKTQNPVPGDVYGTIENNPGTGITAAGSLATDSAYDPDGSLVVGPTTINDLRRAFRLQEWLERNARGGTRYIENILAHFGVYSSDKRLQRPEYITGTKSPVVISEVLNTTGSFDANDTTKPTSPATGSMAGHGVSIGEGYKGSYYVEEHGYIMGIMSVMPKPAYQQGIPKNFLKKDPTEFFWPSFAHIGEQEVQNQEIYGYGANPTDVFGYIPRYAEYKYLPNRIAGEFRTTLDYWHAGRIFGSQPNLSQQFIECDATDVNRIFAVTDPTEDTLYIQVLNKVKAVRPMPVFGTPML
jgi:hypothetical protein